MNILEKFLSISLLLWFSLYASTSHTFAQPSCDLAVVKSAGNAYNTTFRAVELAGGIAKWVKPGQKVGLLINSGFEEKGAYVNPDIPLAIIKMCFDAGASEVVCLQHVIPEYWQRSALYSQHSTMLEKVKTVEKNHFPAKFDSLSFVIIDSVPGSRFLKKTEVVKEVFVIDVFINIPIQKHHATTILTGTMKNMMGLCTRATNVKMHLDGPSRNNPEFLAQCLTDISKIRKPDLYVADLTEVIITNGPGGPGEMASPGLVLAGTDPILMDAYSAEVLGWLPGEIPSIVIGNNEGMGNPDTKKATIIWYDEQR
jgi:uncharacterized protein (DUF362 family)